MDPRWRAARTLALDDDEGPPDAADAIPSVRPERYTPVREVGRGAFGRVMEATDRQFGRAVAVKELLRSDPAARRRFAREAVVTGVLEHPAIPTVYERGVRADGTAFYAMRLVQGRTLADALDAAPDLNARLALLPALIRTAEALGFAHARGVVHRDVKPANVLLGDHGEVVLLDWGLAKVRDLPPTDAEGDAEDAPHAFATRRGAVLGTPAYMAPEQARGDVDAVDERTDVFALGAILYHLLVGRAPYDAQASAEAVRLAATSGFTPIDAAAPAASAGLRAVCTRAMAAVPEARYPNARALAADLEGFLGRAVVAAQGDAVARFANFAVAGAMVLALVASLVVVSAGPDWREQGWVAVVFRAMGALGVALAVVEWRTAGRHALLPLGLGFAAATLCLGLAAIGANFTNVFTYLATPMPEDQWRGVLATGARESLGPLGPAAIFTAVQTLVWGWVAWVNRRPAG